MKADGTKRPLRALYIRKQVNIINHLEVSYHYIQLITEDGKLYQAALELRGIGVYINGVLQDENCDIWVAG